MDLEQKIAGFEKFSVLDLFTEYFSVLVACRNSITDAQIYTSRDTSEDEGEPASMLNEEDLPELTREIMNLSNIDIAPYVGEHLKRYLREQRHWVNEVATAAQGSTYHRALYIMAALTDELFLWEPLWDEGENLELSSLIQNEWQKYLMEKKLFGTASAGDDLFAEVERLDSNVNRTESEEELASVLLLAIRLGFQGQFRGGNNSEINKIQQQLFRLQGGGGNYENQHLFEESYQNRITPRIPGKFVSHRRWYIGTLAAGLLYFFSAIVIYYLSIGPLDQILPPSSSSTR